MTHGPSNAATANERAVQRIAMLSPQRPGMRPEGIGRSGSLIASTWRSNQSLTAWLVAQTIGPASSTPTATSAQRSAQLWPEATAPQANAHMGGNQVMGLSSSATADGAGRAMQLILGMTHWSVNRDLQPRGFQ